MESGTRLGPYEIIEQIGAGGMGEVYRARDAMLDRDVAIKVLPVEIAADGERLARFEREAKLLASLNHPNIATIHGFDESDGVRFIAMELVEGVSLAERLKRGALPTTEALVICTQIAKALDAAHLAGVVHRDLKPANVLLGADGDVRLVDFGIAREVPASPAEITAMPTTDGELTHAGELVGTVPYMSPEQVRGEEVDARSDVWALGCTLYECLVGVSPFARATAPETTAAILIEEPDWSRLPTGLPSADLRLLTRMLEKDPRERLRSAGDAGFEMRSSLDGSPSAMDSSTPTGPVAAGGAGASERVQRLTPIAGAALVALVLVAAYVVLGPRDASERAAVAPPRETPFLIGEAIQDHPAWSPSGSSVAYASDEAGNPDIWITDATGSTKNNLTAEFAGIDDFPAWSPDGTRIAFYSEREGPGIYVMSNIGGRKLKVAQVSAGVHYTFSLRWAASGDLVYTDFDETGSKQVYSASGTGGASQCLTCLLDDAEGQDGDLSPDADLLVYTSGETGPRATLFLGDLRTGEVTVVAEGVDRPRWTGDGSQVVFISARDGMADLWERTIDRSAGRPVGSARRISSGLDLTDFALHAATGKALTVKARTTSHIWRFPVSEQVISSVQGGEQLTFGDVRDRRPRWLPDGAGIVFESDRRGPLDVWMLRLDGQAPVQLTSGNSMDYRPRPSPRGDWIVFDHIGDELDSLYVMRPDGSDVHPLLPAAENIYSRACCAAWSPDGSSLVADVGRRGERLADMVLGIASFDPGTGTVAGFDLHDLPGSAEEYARWSPDGRFIAYESNTEGHWDLWIVSADGTGPHRLSDDLGSERSAVWSKDGSALYYVRDRRETWRIPMGENGRALGPAVPWLQLGSRAVPALDSLDFDQTSALLAIMNRAADIWLVEFDPG